MWSKYHENQFDNHKEFTCHGYSRIRFVNKFFFTSFVIHKKNKIVWIKSQEQGHERVWERERELEVLYSSLPHPPKKYSLWMMTGTEIAGRNSELLQYILEKLLIYGRYKNTLLDNKVFEPLFLDRFSVKVP